jgi:NAD(P)-dependent dehydrogenase (short-subunit alcohol dehydrogenase family)
MLAVNSCREKLQELRDMLLSPQVGMQPSDFLPVVCDVTKEGEVRNLPQIINKHWPNAGIDVLINNAGQGLVHSGGLAQCQECMNGNPCVYAVKPTAVASS